jgi:hypothetical protein
MAVCTHEVILLDGVLLLTGSIANAMVMLSDNVLYSLMTLSSNKHLHSSNDHHTLMMLLSLIHK